MSNPEITHPEAKEAEATTGAAVSPAPTLPRLGTWPYVLGSLAWLVPGLGHALQRKHDRALVFFVSVSAMAILGLAMGAKLYAPPFASSQGLFIAVLHLLGFLGDLGAGLFFFVGWFGGFGREYLARASGDYGTVFFLCAGLLNLLTALDAYDIAVGKKE